MVQEDRCYVKFIPSECIECLILKKSQLSDHRRCATALEPHGPRPGRGPGCIPPPPSTGPVLFGHVGMGICSTFPLGMSPYSAPSSCTASGDRSPLTQQPLLKRTSHVFENGPRPKSFLCFLLSPGFAMPLTFTSESLSLFL